ncbi:hypothetical protein [Cysteiniphilum marinum]|uniref:hypothetical protein n=1 Tax=Cysteiniphilum marinum TaxID=2774191 RepID=UPI00193BE099|nr:hypothetical protein [Cysteiniphilum marinum]
MTSEDYRKMQQAEAERQSKMSHKELFILNGKKAAIKSLVFVVVFYIVLKYFFDFEYTAITLAVLFLFDASFNTFKHKWFGFLRK